MAWIKRSILNTVSEIVMERTGMTEDELVNDSRVYFYPNIPEAAALTVKHIKENHVIRCYGDYDTDGVTSLFILEDGFKTIGYDNVEFIAPRRFSDGYGINVARVKDLYEEGCQLLITIDNGIAALDAIQLARTLGMDVIILDHHEAFVNETGSIELPNANVIVDPHVTGGFVVGENHRFEDLCGAGIGYYFIKELFTQLELNPNLYEDAMHEITIAAGIGTVGDLVELVDDNRRIVRRALEYMSKGYGTAGLRCLMEELNIDHPSSTDIGFGISPCINASGRLYDTGAEMMVKMLMHRECDEELARMVSDAKKTNDDRKEMTRKAVAKAEDMMLDRGDESVIVLLDDELSPGIAGLVSSSLTETYYRPSIVLTKNALNVCKGSGRSIPEVDLKGSLDQVQNLLLAYGGHPMAAGVSMKAENVDAFRDAICAVVPKIPMPTDRYYDIEASTDITELTEILKSIEKFEPYGQGNEPLTVFIPGIELGDSMGNTHRMIGKDKTHVKFMLKNKLDMVWFDGAAEYNLLGKPKKIDVLCELGWNSFNGNTFVQVRIKRLRPAM